VYVIVICQGVLVARVCANVLIITLQVHFVVGKYTACMIN
jgi:hypothetical protein